MSPRLGDPPRPDAKFGAAALTDEREHPYLNELPTLRAQLRSIGPLGEQLYALASRQAASARRTQKHSKSCHRNRNHDRSSKRWRREWEATHTRAHAHAPHARTHMHLSARSLSANTHTHKHSHTPHTHALACPTFYFLPQHHSPPVVLSASRNGLKTMIEPNESLIITHSLRT